MIRSTASRQIRQAIAATLLLAAACCVAPLHAQQAQPSVQAMLQDNYVDSLREQLQRSTRYPTGREASQQRARGEVTVQFALTRDGSVGDVQLVKSSNSMLLDGAALAAVRRTTYPAFITGLYPGQAGHGFQVTLAYTPAGEQTQEPAKPRYVKAGVRADVVAAKP